MKKLILLGAILLHSFSCIHAEEPQNNDIDSQSIINVQSSESEIEFKPNPKHNKFFHLSIANQITLLNQMLTKSGNREVMSYFLALKAQSEQKALEILTKDDNEALRLVILENLPIPIFAKLLTTLFEPIGGDAITHWGYKDEQKLEKSSMTPAVRAQQFINFFMQYNTSHEVQKKHRKAAKFFGEHEEDITVSEPNPEILKLRGQKIAQVLDTIGEEGEEIAINLLYGRLDTWFLGGKDRIQKNAEATEIVYQRLETHGQPYNSREEWVTKKVEEFSKYSQRSRVHANSINYIIPYLSPRLIVAVFAKETNGDNNALISLIKSIGCDKAFGELFEHFNDNIKDKVFETCSNDNSLLDVLGLNKQSNNLAIGDGSDKKDL